jgi:hypothetical protein
VSGGTLPVPLGEAIRRELERMGGTEGAPAGMAEILDRWPAAVGDTVARNAWPARLQRDGTLVVHTSSSTWAQELTQLEPAVRDQLGCAARLRFVVGPLPEPDTASAPDVRRSVHTPTDRETDRGAEIARAIEDPGLREQVARACALSLAAARDGPADRSV